MTYLVDTDWIIDWLKNKPDAVDLLRHLVKDGLAISLVSYGEIYEGIYYGRDKTAAERAFLQFLRGVTVLSLNRRIMQRFARIRGQLRQTGQLIGDPDILIAATALYHNLVLVTQNQKHFQRIDSLHLHHTSKTSGNNP